MFVKRRPSPEPIEVLGTKVLLITQDYTKQEEFIQYGDPIREFDTDMNFVTIASAQAKDVRIEDYDFTETTHVFIDLAMHRLIQFDLPPMKLSELVFNISRIYTEIFKRFAVEADVCCTGYELLYLQKIKVHPDNVVSLKIYQRLMKRKKNTFARIMEKINIFRKKTK